MFRPLARRLVGLLLALAAPTAALAQLGPQRVHVEAPHLDVYVAEGQQPLGRLTARYAEQAWLEVSAYFRHQPETRFVLQAYPSYWAYEAGPNHPPFAQARTRQLPVRPVYYPGSRHAYYQQLKTRLARLMLEDLVYGGTGLVALQNRWLLNLPPWFAQGLSRYLGEGWTPEDEARMRSLMDSNPEALLLSEEPDPAAWTVQKSLWHYIARQFGPGKAAEIAYMTRVTRSVRNGVAAGLGTANRLLLDAWWEDAQKQYRDDRPELALDPNADSLTLAKPGEELLAVALAPNGIQLAATVWKGGQYRVWLYERGSGRRRPTPIRGKGQRTKGAMAPPHVPMAWHPNSTQLAVAVPDGPTQKLVYYNLRDNAYTPVPLSLDGLTHLSWAPDGQTLATTGYRDGQTDLYLTRLRSKAFRPLTRDGDDDLAPVFTPDGAGLLVASTRQLGVALPRELDTLYNPTRRNLDLYLALLKPDQDDQDPDAPASNDGRLAFDRLTETPLANEQPLFTLDSLYAYRTDASGLPNLAAYRPGRNQHLNLTNYHTGLLGAFPTKALTVVVATAQGQPKAFTLKRLNLSQDLPAPLTPYAKTQLEAYLDAEGEAIPNPEPEPEPEPEPTPLPDDDAEGNEPPSADTAAPPPLRFYLFDEDDLAPTPVPPPTRRPRRLRVVEDETPAAPNPLDTFRLNALRLGATQPYRLRPFLTAVELTPGVDPIFGLNLHAQVNLEDPFWRHKLTLGFKGFWGFRNATTTLRYHWRRRWLEVGGQFQLTNRFLERDLEFGTDGVLLQRGQAYRYTAYEGEAWLATRLQDHHRLELGLGLAHLNQLDLQLNDDADRNERALIFPLRLRYSYDDRAPAPNWLTRGTQAQATLAGALNAGGQALGYPTLRLQARREQPLYGMQLTLRAAGGMALATPEPTFFLGGWANWLNQTFDNEQDIPLGQSVEAFYFSDVITPIRGFSHNARSGSKYALLSAELALPISRWLAGDPLIRPNIQVDWVWFYDIGTAWREGNPFSQRNPIDAAVINKPPLNVTVEIIKSPFLMGMGTGLQLSAYGLQARLDLAVGVEDGTVGDLQVGLLIGRNL